MTDSKSFFVLTISKLIESYDCPSHRAFWVAKNSKISVARLKRAAEINNLLSPEMVAMICRSKRPEEQVKVLLPPKAIQAGGGVKRVLKAVQDCQKILDLLKRGQEKSSHLQKVA